MPTTLPHLQPVAIPHSDQLSLWRDEFIFRLPGLPVMVQRNAQSDCAPHRHEFTEIVFILRGRGWHRFGELRKPLRPGQLLVLSGRQTHGFQDVEQLELVNVLLCRHFLRDHQRSLAAHPGIRRLFPNFPAPTATLAAPRLFQLAPDQLEHALALVHEMEVELRRLAPGFATVLNGLALELLGRLGRLATEHDGSPDTATLRRQQLHAVFALLEQRYGETLSLTLLAQTAHLSPRSLERHFREAAGLSPVQYLLQLRLTHAARLLRETALPVRELARRCGFRNLSYFARRFHHAAGLTPHRYRTTAMARQNP